ncbi:unnamed protein product [Durusdinium trenchii]|uniref:Uncharacterized protein n=1 Tax=Durusdinium trenchii TaxID=1381693 RepID=A0ABP0LFF8_9DINO
MVAYDKAKSEGVKNPCSHVAQMNLRGYYRCCFYKWSRARQAQQWTLVCSAAPKLAKRYKELPDVLRKLVGLKLKFRQKSSDQGESSATLPAGLTEDPQILLNELDKSAPEKPEEVTQETLANIHESLCSSLPLVKVKDITTGDSEEIQLPGGWGAAGGPNDGFHQYWHQLVGDEERVKSLMQRAKSSMQAILELSVLPKMSTDPDEGAELERLRREPLHGEEQLHWAVQCGDDVQSRQALPSWLSNPIERSISKWVEEHNSWMQKIDARMMIGKNLTATTQKNFEKWSHERASCNLLFSRKKQAPVHSIRSHTELSRMEKDLFSVHVAFSMDPQELQLRASNGDSQRLLLLKGAPSKDGCVPGFLNQKPNDSDLQQAMQEEEQEPGSEHESGMEDDRGFQDEQEALLEQDNSQERGEDVEVLADTSDEEAVKQTVSTIHTRVKSFFHRPAYKALADRGLVDLPCMSGVLLSYHSTSRCWQGYYPGCHQRLSMTWGGRTLRSEAEALIRVLIGVVRCYTDQFPKDKLWRKQLEKLQLAEASVGTL